MEEDITNMIAKVSMALAEADGVGTGYDDLARVAIEAMRVPDEEMMLAGGFKLEAMLFENDEEYTGVIFKDAGVVFRVMVDAALASQPTITIDKE